MREERLFEVSVPFSAPPWPPGKNRLLVVAASAWLAWRRVVKKYPEFRDRDHEVQPLGRMAIVAHPQPSTPVVPVEEPPESS